MKLNLIINHYDRMLSPFYIHYIKYSLLFPLFFRQNSNSSHCSCQSTDFINSVYSREVQIKLWISTTISIRHVLKFTFAPCRILLAYVRVNVDRLEILGEFITISRCVSPCTGN